MPPSRRCEPFGREPHLPLDRLEDAPARLVGVPLVLFEIARHEPVHQRLEERGEPAQPVRQRARREREPPRPEVRHQAPRRAVELVLVEQHVHPHRGAIEALGDQLRRRRSHDDRRQVRALARRLIAPAPQPPPIRPDPRRLHLVRILAAPHDLKRQPADRAPALLRRKLHPLLDDRQVSIALAAVAGRPTPMPAGSAPRGRLLGPLAPPAQAHGSFRLAAEERAFAHPELRLECLDLLLERLLALARPLVLNSVVTPLLAEREEFRLHGTALAQPHPRALRRKPTVGCPCQLIGQSQLKCIHAPLIPRLASCVQRYFQTPCSLCTPHPRLRYGLDECLPWALRNYLKTRKHANVLAETAD